MSIDNYFKFFLFCNLYKFEIETYLRCMATAGSQIVTAIVSLETHKKKTKLSQRQVKGVAMASSDSADDSLYPIAVLIDELRNEDVQV